MRGIVNSTSFVKIPWTVDLAAYSTLNTGNLKTDYHTITIRLIFNLKLI